MATPRYRLTAPTFIAPYYLEAGSEIATESQPGPHMIPLNDEAKAALEEFYDKEIDGYDKDGNVVKTKPYKNFRPLPPAEIEAQRATVVLVKDPPKQISGGMDLATAQIARAEPMEGPPRAEPIPDSDSLAEIEPVPPTEGTTDNGGLVLKSAPSTSNVKVS